LTGALGIEIKEADPGTPWHSALFLLGAFLFIITISCNIAARKIMKKMNEKFQPKEKETNKSFFPSLIHRLTRFWRNRTQINKNIRTNQLDSLKKNQIDESDAIKSNNTHKSNHPINYKKILIFILGVMLFLFIILKWVVPLFGWTVTTLSVILPTILILFAYGSDVSVYKKDVQLQKDANENLDVKKERTEDQNIYSIHDVILQEKSKKIAMDIAVIAGGILGFLLFRLIFGNVIAIFSVIIPVIIFVVGESRNLKLHKTISAFLCIGSIVFEIIRFNLGLITGLIAIIVMGFFIALWKTLKPKQNQLFSFTIITIATLSVLALLAILIIDLAIRAFPHYILVDYYTEEMYENGLQGGVVGQIIGTFYLIMGTILVAMPIGILAGIYLAEYAKPGRMLGVINTGIDNLNSTPSIVFGLFGLLFFVRMMQFGQCLLAGILTMSLMVLPTIIRTTENAIRSVPKEMRNGSYAMGASKWSTIRKVILPTARPQIITGIILSMGRIAGETAPILYTAANFRQNLELLPDLNNTIQILSYHIYRLRDSYGDAEIRSEMAAAASFVLLLLVMGLFLIASWVRKRSEKKGLGN
ncbi:MAG: phosphate ABC transporter permease PstA, partial [Candidatus Lokiarchaeota archaeon]|nr:phosphate ABC transporter permease PstA [Candidatus Lokiarchaeota archaeon]